MSLFFGIVAWFNTPIFVPLIGLALGINTVIKSKEIEHPKPNQTTVGVLGIVLSSVPIFLIFIASLVMSRSR
jgi:hypothetical protein